MTSGGAKGFGKLHPINRADHKQVDVAGGIVLGRDIGAEEKGESDSSAFCEDTRKLGRQPTRPTEELADRLVKRISRIHAPKA